MAEFGDRLSPFRMLESKESDNLVWFHLGQASMLGGEAGIGVAALDLLF